MQSKEHIKRIKKEYYEKNKKIILEKTKIYYQNNRKKILERESKYYRKNITKRKEYYHQYDKDNRGKRNKDRKYKYDNDILFRLRHNISNAINQSLKSKNLSKNGTHWEEIVGYTKEELKQYIEKLFKPGMTWENKGKWHIDHIIPVSFFQYASTQDTEFKYCWSLLNLQPLWAKENFTKSDNLISSC